MAATGSLVLARVLPATPEEVFAAWATPERMAAWMSPVGHAEAHVDLRVGDISHVVMVGDHDRTQVDPPRRLAFTWVSAYTDSEPSLITVELHSRGDGTRLALTHERLPGDVVESHRGGWGSMLARSQPSSSTRVCTTRCRKPPGRSDPWVRAPDPGAETRKEDPMATVRRKEGAKG